MDIASASGNYRTFVQVFSAEYPVVEMGERFSTSDRPTLQVCAYQWFQ